MACQGGEEKPMRDIASSSGYCYPDIQSHLVNQLQLQSFVSNPEIYNLNPGPGYDSTANWHDEGHNRLLVDDSSVMIHGQRPTGQGLSLSLCSINPFELRQRQDAHMRFDSSTSRSDGFFSKSMNIQPVEDGFSGKSLNLYQYGNFHISNSKYLGPAQELLMEFCNLGTKEEVGGLKPKTRKAHKTDLWQLQVDDQKASSSSSRSSLELLELQKRKAKLLSMLEEVDRRYRNYCEQMKAVISSFEAVASEGAARVYSVLASKAMSRHFRNLRDGIVGQIKATKKALGEKDVGALGMTRGETPRLRLLDQSLRQQRAFQQMNMMESHPWRPQRGLPERSVCVLRAWLFEHFLHPYPSDVDKHILSRQTGLSRSQVANWFINARVRLWKPMVEEMYLEETKEQDNMASSDDNGSQPGDGQNYPQGPSEDQKPSREQLVRIDYESLSSLINHPEKNEISSHTKSPQNHNYGFCRVGDTFGAVELDFSAYNQNYGGGSTSTGGGTSNGGGVSLTLGLQQHGAGGASLELSPVFYGRDHMDEDCQPVQYSLLDGDHQGQNLPYRNLMGAQLLRDLAG